LAVHVAIYTSGILGLIRGRVGPGYFRRTSIPGAMTYHSSMIGTSTPSQIESRRRLSVSSKVGSKIYLSHLKPMEYYYATEYNAIADFCRVNLPTWYEFRDVPRLGMFNYYLGFLTLSSVRIQRYPLMLTVRWGYTTPSDFTENDDFYFFMVIGSRHHVRWKVVPAMGQQGEFFITDLNPYRGDLCCTYGAVLRKNPGGIHLPYGHIYKYYYLR